MSFFVILKEKIKFTERHQQERTEVPFPIKTQAHTHRLLDAGRPEASIPAGPPGAIMDHFTLTGD